MLGALFSAGAGLLGGILGNKSAERQQDENTALQREFAQNGIRWKVADAQAAGLHPLAALGSSGASYTPSAVVGGDSGIGAAGQAIGDFIDGQNTKRAQTATMTAQEREMQALALQRAQLQNRLLEAQINSEWASVMGQPPTPPMAAAAGPVVAPVVARSGPRAAPPGLVEHKPSESISAAPGQRGIEAGTSPFFKAHPISNQSAVLLPSQQASEAIEALGPWAAPGIYAKAAWDRFRHGPGAPEQNLAPKGYVWEWSPWSQSYKLVKPAAPAPYPKPQYYRNR